MREQHYINHCLNLIGEKLGSGPPERWGDGMYEALREDIFAASNVLISKRTLKRLYGKGRPNEDFYNPQPGTKNALAIFLGYAGWDDFKKNTVLPGTTERAPEPVPAPASVPAAGAFAAGVRNDKPPAKAPAGKKTLWFTGLGVAVMAAYALWLFSTGGPAGKTTLVSFDGSNLKGHAPLSPAFTYRVSGSTDSLFMEFSDTVQRRLTESSGSLVHFYKKPGIYPVTIRSGSRELGRLDVCVFSRDWEGGMGYLLNDPGLFEPLPRVNGMLADQRTGRIDRTRLTGYHPERVFWADYRLIREFGLSGDDFSFETRVFNTDTLGHGGIGCRDVMIIVAGEQGDVILHLIGPGCLRWIIFRVGDVAYNGEDTIIRGLEHDLSVWRRISFTVKNKTARFFLDGRPILRQPYSSPLGRIRGIIFKFRESGLVDYVRLYDRDGKFIYGDDFQ